MQFTEPAEVEDLVGLLRSERMQQVATAELLQWAGSRRGNVPGRNANQAYQTKGSVFGADHTVARLFSGSPPANTYTVEDEDLRDEYIHPQFSTTKEPVVSKSGKGEHEPQDSKPKPSSVLEFKLEPVAVAESVRKTGVLTEMFYQRPPNRQASSHTPQHKSHKSDGGLHLSAQQLNEPEITLILPDSTTLCLRYTKTMTIEQMVHLALKSDKRLPQNPDVYEIRLSDDGQPDDDVPALDPVTLVATFCGSEQSELCLCIKPESDETMLADPAPQAAQGQKHAKIELEKRGIYLIKVSNPENGTHTTVNVTPDMHVIDLLSIIRTKQRLSFLEDYYFTCAEREVGMKENLVDSGITELEIRRKKYADAPSVGNEKGDEGSDFFPEGRNSAAIHVDHVDHVIQNKAALNRYDPDNFLFNDQTAALYEEWNVIKTNKWGKRQSRVLGIDFQKVYNKKQEKDLGKSNILPNQNVKRRERAIGEIRRLHILPTDPSCVQIFWKDQSSSNSTGEVALKYEIENGPEAAAHIVAKLKYIISSRT